ncbi:MAG TPA: hypothetical protein VNS09_17560 [Solirubrobacter sp.]|nr:hypothetical protein [Solirubrobacter sp.]
MIAKAADDAAVAANVDASGATAGVATDGVCGEIGGDGGLCDGGGTRDGNGDTGDGDVGTEAAGTCGDGCGRRLRDWLGLAEP